MRIAVVGAGGVGGLLGGRLAQTGVDVHLVARGAHLSAIRDRGLQLSTPDGDATITVPATDDPAQIGPCDAVLFCVKAYDTDAAAALLSPLLKDTTAVVSLQNGVDNEQRLAAAIGQPHVLGGAAFVFAAIAEPGVVTYTGPPPRVALGELDGTRSERAEQLAAVLTDAGVATVVAADIRAVLWRKFAFICAVGGMTAATRLPIGAIRDCPAAWAMLRRIVAEVCAVAHAEGVTPPPADEVVATIEQLPAEGRASLYHDLAAGRRMELEALHGTACRLAARHGLAAPMCEAVYAILQPVAQQNEREAKGT